MISIKITNSGNLINIENFIIKYIKENTTCKINEKTDIIDLYIDLQKSEISPSYYFINNHLDIRFWTDTVDEEYLKTICKAIFRKYNIESLDYDIQFRDPNTVADIEDKLNANYDKDTTRKVYMKDLNEPEIELHTARRAKGSIYYLTRRSFNDIEGEKYAGPSLVKAIAECDKYAGMSVFNQSGKLIYKSTRNKITPIQDYSNMISKHSIIHTSTGTGIYVAKGNRRYHIPDGTEVTITKMHNTKTEILVTIANEKFTAEVDSSCLL